MQSLLKIPYLHLVALPGSRSELWAGAKWLTPCYCQDCFPWSTGIYMLHTVVTSYNVGRSSGSQFSTSATYTLYMYDNSDGCVANWVSRNVHACSVLIKSVFLAVSSSMVCVKDSLCWPSMECTPLHWATLICWVNWAPSTDALHLSRCSSHVQVLQSMPHSPPRQGGWASISRATHLSSFME